MAKVRTLSEQMGFLPPRPLLVTYISHYPAGWQGRPFLCCREHMDAYSVLDWIKQRELQFKPTIITSWVYTDGGEPV